MKREAALSGHLQPPLSPRQPLVLAQHQVAFGLTQEMASLEQQITSLFRMLLLTHFGASDGQPQDCTSRVIGAVCAFFDSLSVSRISALAGENIKTISNSAHAIGTSVQDCACALRTKAVFMEIPSLPDSAAPPR